ncbi:16S rRNA (uracil(1498)-N(3))-methyltransferase [Mycoplasmopsis gallinarum]|uniref:16S rRNA (uracil(1498)-N(3))-methyltransferase n=1 Tax=Mycoplasmopsis gallinarum TaxID=29557 RepID=UPI0004832FA7
MDCSYFVFQFKKSIKNQFNYLYRPEGGFSKKEVAEVQKFQVKIIILGKTILIAELLAWKL